MKTRYYTLIFFSLLVHLVCAQQLIPLPLDTTVRSGQLANGLTYYVARNLQPKGCADFYIVQRVGSVLEEETQRGLAHFLEHMAFNGTKHFPDKQLLAYLEANGVKFGANVNAYTSFDETVYNLTDVPVTRSGMIDSCLLILRDWSCDISLTDKAIDQERGVIREEWRTRSNATQRMYEAAFPTLFAGSRYARRMPIGDMQIIETFTPETLRDYYRRWYRPDLQAIVVVGDINVEQVEQNIKSLFSTIPLSNQATERIYFPVPDNKEPLVSVLTDKEASNTILSLHFKYDPLPPVVARSAQLLITEYFNSLIELIFSERVKALTQQTNTPINAAYVYDDKYFVANTKEAFTAVALTRESGALEALKALWLELQRVARHGFTSGEYARAKASYQSSLQNTYNNRAKRRNNELTRQYIDHFLTEKALPGIEYEYDFYRQVMPLISLERLNEYVAGKITPENIVVAVMGPEKEGVSYPTASEVISALKEVSAQEITPNEDDNVTEPLISTLPTPGSVTKSTLHKAGQFTQWELSNGAIVLLKPTTFDDDQILLEAISVGGTSLISPAESISAKMLDAVSKENGLGGFTSLQLQKQLAGKNVSLTPSVTNLTEVLSGGASCADIETLFQLTHLFFTAITPDTSSFTAWKESVAVSLKNRDAYPKSALIDSLTLLTYGDNPLTNKWAVEELATLDYPRLIALQQERFANAADFVFVLTGSFDIDSMRPFVERYIASLPATSGHERIGKNLPYIQKGSHVRHFDRTMLTPVATAYRSYNSRLPYTVENRIRVDMLKQILTMLFTETLREEEGGTYGVAVQSSLTPMGWWTLSYFFDTDPLKADTLMQRAAVELNKLLSQGIPEKYLRNVQEYMLKEHTKNLRENRYWVDLITKHALYGNDAFVGYDRIVIKQTPKDMQRLLKQVLKSPDRVEVVMRGVQP